MGISELRRPAGGRVPHRVSQTIEGAAIVTVGNPDDLAISEAGSRGEAHRVGCG